MFDFFKGRSDKPISMDRDYFKDIRRKTIDAETPAIEEKKPESTLTEAEKAMLDSCEGASADELQAILLNYRLKELNKGSLESEKNIVIFEKAVEELIAQREKNKDQTTFPVRTLRVDSSFIDLSSLDIISVSDDIVSVDFRLTKEYYQFLQTHIFPLLLDFQRVSKDFTFQTTDGDSNSICEATSIVIDQNVEIVVANGKREPQNSDDPYAISRQYKSMEGYVSLKFKNITSMDDIAVKIQEALERLGLGGISLLSGDVLSSDQQLDDYLDHNKLNSADIVSQLDLTSKDLGNGYLVTEDIGVSKEYMGDKPLVLLHTSPEDNIVQILQTGLLSRMERYRRGIGQKNIPNTPDMESGGADSVFIGTFKQENLEAVIPNNGVTFIFKPNILDRQDWYAYNSAKFGSTDPKIMKGRPSPKDFFDSQRNNNILSNEIMMNRIITLDYIDSMVVSNQEKKDRLIGLLQEAGLSAILGKDLDSLILTLDEFKDQR